MLLLFQFGVSIFLRFQPLVFEGCTFFIEILGCFKGGPKNVMGLCFIIPTIIGYRRYHPLVVGSLGFPSTRAYGDGMFSKANAASLVDIPKESYCDKFKKNIVCNPERKKTIQHLPTFLIHTL